MHQYCLPRQATLRNNRRIVFEGLQWTIWYTMNVCNHIPLMQQLFFLIVENNSNNKNTTAAPKTLRCIPKQVLFIQSSLELHTWAQKKQQTKRNIKKADMGTVNLHELNNFCRNVILLPQRVLCKHAFARIVWRCDSNATRQHSSHSAGAFCTIPALATLLKVRPKVTCIHNPATRVPIRIH